MKCKRGTVNYLGFGTQSGIYGQAGGLQTVSSKDVTEMDMTNTETGEFDIVISAEKPSSNEKNWMALRGPAQGGPTKAMIIVRQTFLDRAKEVPAEFELTRTSGKNAPSPLTCERLEDALQTAGLLSLIHI